MNTRLSPEVRESEPARANSNDIYYEARGVQLASLCGTLASWGASKYRHHPPVTYQPGTGETDTRLILIGGDNLVGLEIQATSSPDTKRSIRKAIDKISKSDPSEPIVAKSTRQGINTKGESELWLTLKKDPTEEGTPENSSPKQDESMVIDIKRQRIQEVLGDASEIPFNIDSDCQSEILLMTFEPDVIPELSLEALRYKIQENALPLPVYTGEMVLPAWMRQPS